MAIGFRAVGGHESVGLWGVGLFAVPLLAAWYSFERLAVISRTSEQTIEALSVVPEMAGLAAEGHAARVAELSVRVGDALGLRRRALDDLRAAALLHHLGHLCLDAPEVRDEPIEPYEVADQSAAILRQTDLASAGDLLATESVSVGGQVLRLASAYDDLRGGPRPGVRARRARRRSRVPLRPTGVRRAGAGRVRGRVDGGPGRRLGLNVPQVDLGSRAGRST